MDVNKYLIISMNLQTLISLDFNCLILFKLSLHDLLIHIKSINKYFNDIIDNHIWKYNGPIYFNKNLFTDSILLSYRFITSLDLCYNNVITDKSLEKLTSLTSLNLSCNKVITDKSLEKLTSLTSLNLSNNKVITDESLKKLTSLTSLDLSYNGVITDKSL